MEVSLPPLQPSPTPPPTRRPLEFSDRGRKEGRENGGRAERRVKVETVVVDGRRDGGKEADGQGELIQQRPMNNARS